MKKKSVQYEKNELCAPYLCMKYVNIIDFSAYEMTSALTAPSEQLPNEFATIIFQTLSTSIIRFCCAHHKVFHPIIFNDNFPAALSFTLNYFQCVCVCSVQGTRMASIPIEIALCSFANDFSQILIMRSTAFAILFAWHKIDNVLPVLRAHSFCWTLIFHFLSAGNNSLWKSICFFVLVTVIMEM